MTEISTLPSDSYLTEKNLIPDLIKIDTEGYELQVLDRASNTINKFKPMIIFEENEGYEQRLKIADFLRAPATSYVDYPIWTNKKFRLPDRNS